MRRARGAYRVARAGEALRERNERERGLKKRERALCAKGACEECGATKFRTREFLV